MIFKFVREAPYFKEQKLTINSPVNFVLESPHGKYGKRIFWRKLDMPPFFNLPNLFPVDLPPDDDDNYPVEAVVVTLYKDGFRYDPIFYYGFSGTLYVMNDDGKTIDKLSTNSCFHGEAEKKKLQPPWPLANHIPEKEEVITRKTRRNAELALQEDEAFLKEASGEEESVDDQLPIR